MYFFGVSMPLKSAIAYIIGAFFLGILLPVLIIDAFADNFPSPIREILSFFLIVIAFPSLLCLMHKKKMFGQGNGSLFFRFYTIAFTLFGLIITSIGLFGDEIRMPMVSTGGVILAMGIAMFQWAKKVDGDFKQAIQAQHEEQAAIERENQIDMHAEAIVRAEQMKKKLGN